MPPKSAKFKSAHMSAVAHGLSKAAPSDEIRNPADDVQTDTGRGDQMHEGKLEFLFVNRRTTETSQKKTRPFLPSRRCWFQTPSIAIFVAIGPTSCASVLPAVRLSASSQKTLHADAFLLWQVWQMISYAPTARE